MSPPIADPLVKSEIFVIGKQTTVDTKEHSGNAVEFDSTLSSPVADISVGQAKDETAIVVTRRRRDWIKYFLALLVLMLMTVGAVTDQQLSKFITSDSFRAPFLYLWCSGLTRSFIYAVYLPFRLIYEYTYNRRDAKKKTSYPTPPRPVRKIIEELIDDALLAFGPSGITSKSFLLNILPFSLSWILTNGLFYWSVNFSSVSESVTIGSSFVVITYFVSWIILKEKLLVVKGVGIVICLSGVGLTAYTSGVAFGQSVDSVYGALLTTGSSISLALTTVAFKKLYRTPNFNQIAMFLSIISATNALISWPVFLMLWLTGKEVWTFATAPWGLIFLGTSVSAGSSMLYYLGISMVSPVFVSLSRPLQIVMNYGIDLARETILFNALSAVGMGLVLLGFLIMIVPNNYVSLELKTYSVWFMPNRKFVLNHSHSDSELPSQLKTNFLRQISERGQSVKY